VRLFAAALLFTAAAPLAAQEHHHHPAEATPAQDAQTAPETSPPTDEPAVGSQPPPAIPRDHAADAYWGNAAMAPSRDALLEENGAFSGSMLKIDRFEREFRRGADGYHLKGEAWLGGDLNRAVIEVEGETATRGPVERFETQLHYSRAIAPYFNLRAGVRHDFRPGPQRSYAVLGVQGIAPYWFDVEGLLFLSTRGHLSARIEGSVDQRLTQKLILQPRAELNFAAQDDRAIRVGAGLSDAELGLRLRYEISPQFAPYIGVEWNRSVGRTAHYVRAAGEDADTVSLLAGVRFWF